MDSFQRIFERKILRFKPMPGCITGINFMVFILSFVENYGKNDAIHDFLVWLRANSHPADNNRFRSHTGTK